MTAPATIIRQAAVSILQAVLAPIPVYDSRSIPLAPTDLPAICVYTPQRTGESASTSTPRMRSTVTVRVECHVRVPAGATEATADARLEEARDALTWAAEGALLSSQAWRALWERIVRVSDASARDADSEYRLSVGILEIQGSLVAVHEPTYEDTLDIVHLVFDLMQPTKDGTDGPDGTPEAVADIDLAEGD